MYEITEEECWDLKQLKENVACFNSKLWFQGQSDETWWLFLILYRRWTKIQNSDWREMAEPFS